MVKAYFITRVAPFQIEESSYTIKLKDVAALFVSLAYDIQKLQKALSANWITVQWCTEAMILLKKMHAEFLKLFQSLKVPMISWNGINELLDEYMNESLNILELCNLLKSAISGMSMHILKTDIAIRSMCDNEFLADIRNMDRQEMKLNGIQKWKNDDNLKVSMHRNNNKYCITDFICAIRDAINILCSILFCVICHPIPVEIEKEIHSELPQMKLFQDSIEDLAKCFGKKSNIAGENLSVAFLEKAITDTESQLKRHSLADREKLERIKARIQQELASIKVGLEMFESEIEKVFGEVLRGRNELLQKITTSNEN